MSTDISITEENTEVLVDEISDIESYRNASASVTFRVTESWTVDAYSYNLMLSNGSSWRFTSDIVENPKSLTFSNTNYYQLFRVSDSERLDFIWLDDVCFIGNAAAASVRLDGGVIEGGEYSTINFSNNHRVKFSDNSVFAATCCGGAIDGDDYCVIKLCDNGSVEFSGNKAGIGGAVAGYDSTTIELHGNGSVLFDGNTANDAGGAICCTISMSDNGNVEFIENAATSKGGAICGYAVLSNNDSVLFEGNTVSSTLGDSAYGGAIYANNGLSIQNNHSVLFEQNSISAHHAAQGGAIYSLGSVNISSNAGLHFIGNYASSYYSQGGAIYAGGTLNICNNDEVSFCGNYVSSDSSSSQRYEFGGGAIYAESSLSLTSNESLIFEENFSLTTPNSMYSYGGAIYACSSLSICDNTYVTFNANYAASSSDSGGGAIHTTWDTTLDINNNVSVNFTRNYAKTTSTLSYDSACGGAIGARSMIRICNNASVFFRENYIEHHNELSGGGAIYAMDDIYIQGNESVEFRMNYEKNDSGYRLRGIYQYEGSMHLSAKTDGQITFYDSVYGGETSLNADYTDAEGKTQKAKGDIIFSGLYTKAHLDAILEENNEGREATEAEILNSRTSILGETSLYGGRLRVEDGAIYQGQGITVHDGSEATVLVKDATLNHEGYALTFNAGTSLQVEGESLIVGDVLMMAQSVLNLEEETTINGALTLGLGLQLAGNILTEVQSLQVGESLTLVSGLESLAVQTQNLMRSVEYTTVMDGYEVQASEYFANLAGNTGLVMRYDGEAGTVSITQTMAVPEPTTATLSLLALAALAMRRRRK